MVSGLTRAQAAGQEEERVHDDARLRSLQCGASADLSGYKPAPPRSCTLRRRRLRPGQACPSSAHSLTQRRSGRMRERRRTGGRGTKRGKGREREKHVMGGKGEVIQKEN